ITLYLRIAVQSRLENHNLEKISAVILLIERISIQLSALFKGNKTGKLATEKSGNLLEVEAPKRFDLLII
ncbi:MAG: hypothetical protein WA997_02915, partial [Anaerolineales bacterium]